MKKEKSSTTQTGSLRTTFVFDPQELEITNLYLTALFDDRGYESARIFSNGVMKARLILKYNYSYNPDEFAGMTDSEIISAIETQSYPYLQDKANLQIYEAVYSSKDILDSKSPWKKEFSHDNLTLQCLDNASYLAAEATRQAEDSGSDDSITRTEPLATATAHLTMNIYVIPPTRRKFTYTLCAKHLLTGEETNSVTVQAEVFTLTKDDLELQPVASADVTFPGMDTGYCNCVMSALRYKDDKYGAARLINITKYVGWVLDPNSTNICLIHSAPNGLSGIFYYPSPHNKNQLFAGTEGSTYSNVLSMSSEFDLSGIELTCKGGYWNWLKAFSEAQVEAAHDLGIPVFASYQEEVCPLTYGTLWLYLGELRDPEFFTLQDNCGNTIALRFHGMWDVDQNREAIYAVIKHGTTSDGWEMTSELGDFSKWKSYYDVGSPLLEIKRANPKH